MRRRTVLKLLAGGTVALYLRPFDTARAAPALGALSGWSPIDRSLPNVAPKSFFADDPETAHKILWDKASYIQSIGGKVPEPTEKVPLVIVGGGLSGLVTAYLLREHKPIILEQAPRFGGNAKGQSWRGIDYSIGAAYFIEPEADTDIANLLAEVGVDKLWKVKEEEDPVAINGKIYNEFWTGETAPEAKEQLTKLAEYFAAVNEGEKYPYPDIPIVDPEQKAYIDDLDKISFRALIEKIGGTPIHPHVETAIEQYCWSSFGGSMSEISAACGLNFYASEFSNLVLLPGGNSAVAEVFLGKLAQELPAVCLRPSSLVFDVTVGDAGARISYVDGQGKPTTIEADTVVMSCPKFVVKRIVNDLEPERVGAMYKLRYRSYLVANLLLTGNGAKSFYDLYMLGSGRLDGLDATAASQRQKVTDVILADYASPNPDNTVLTLYRGMPYDGARADLYSPGSYGRYREMFEKQIHESILPLLGLKKEHIVDLRIARWGHPLPLAATGLIADGTLEKVRAPFRDRMFFVEQDNWALPAFETAVTEALTWAPKIAERLKAKAE